MTEPAPAAAEAGGGGGGGESFGRYLSQQRELRGLSLQNVADSTKLSVTTLKALESDDLSRLPERVFILGFVKAYAKSVGLSAEETALRFEESLGKTPSKPSSPAGTPRSGSRRALALLGVCLAAAAAAAALHFHLFR